MDLFLAGFNLLLVLLAALAASYLIRRLVGLEEAA